MQVLLLILMFVGLAADYYSGQNSVSASTSVNEVCPNHINTSVFSLDMVESPGRGLYLLFPLQEDLIEISDKITLEMVKETVSHEHELHYCEVFDSGEKSWYLKSKPIGMMDTGQMYSML